ncbi:hypothetical protein KC363_g1667 [Hortaea werneckii]|uniref:2',3'-cyclic-nucleotide 3'-phosphodiesterase n=1 Tax=Hortaea werneckii TaxID=91943 RepID=A0A3M7G589_HORWE|nr:hypothetical protein KC359_g2847 [Hortaea werneckii]KAI7148711.1 hypothetical protein KC344_g1726 [Hortaea werneckii]KAI7178333.1 hypothetical protein KC360_g1698 [Hortaea werneckii]KAI7195271.1 hypothetical protein KC363_g1667 [Hortaea werneckii]RMY96067.1 hypothetical protein D0861_00259 [Hortaea werneckii]
MGGSSLWLVPPEDSALYRTCHQLITTHIPSLFPLALSRPPLFTPHVTLTSDTVPPHIFPEQEQQRSSSSQTPPSPTDSAISSAQRWLDSLDLPPPRMIQEGLKVKIQKVQVEGHFFRKLTLRCEKSPQLCELAATCRARRGGEGLVGGGEQNEAWEWVREHYAPHLSLMYSDLPEDEVQLKLDEVNSIISQAQQANPDSLSTKGGEIWLVPTSKPLAQWQPIAKREIPYGVQWEWQA